MDQDPYDEREITPRIGTFLFVLGIFLFILFMASDFADQPDFDLLVISLILLVVGIAFRRRAKAPPSSGRFNWIRKLREEAKKRKEEKENKKLKDNDKIDISF
ncbi:MAG: hypothetical protein QGD88_09085 [Anaerolineae bacterium]|nr:hypothetical protein [Anaerolineae bacterium]MDK1081619.1 hypothetical protein [Anaerolineae bacterium]